MSGEPTCAHPRWHLRHRQAVGRAGLLETCRVPVTVRRVYRVELRRHDHEWCTRYIYGRHIIVIDSMPPATRTAHGRMAPFPLVGGPNGR